MNGLPYYKAYPRDFIEGTIGMDFETKAAYRLVLDLIYMQGGYLPDDARYISGLLGCSVKKWNLLRKTLVDEGKIYVRGEFLGNYRADKELESLGTFQEKQRKNRSNPNKNNEIKSPPANHTEPDTDTDSTTEGKPPVVEAPSEPANPPAEKPSSPKTKKASRIPNDWMPTLDDRQYALAKGIPAGAIDGIAEEFRNFWQSEGGQRARKLDWSKAFRNRCIAKSERFAERQSRFPPKPPDKPGNRGGFATILQENMDDLLRNFSDEQPQHYPDDDWRTEPEIIPPGVSDPRGFSAGGQDLRRDENRADGLSNVFDFRQARAYG